MNKLGTIGLVLIGLAVLLVQVTMLRELVLFGKAFCFFYLFVFFIVPVDTNRLLQLFLGFSVGLLVDMFYSTQGVHAAASVFLMFVRPYWLNILSPGTGYGAAVRINIRSQGLQWFLTFTYPLILVHGILLFFVEAFGFENFWITIAKAFYSSLFTMVVIVLIQYLFLKKER